MPPFGSLKGCLATQDCQLINTSPVPCLGMFHTFADLKSGSFRGKCNNATSTDQGNSYLRVAAELLCISLQDKPCDMFLVPSSKHMDWPLPGLSSAAAQKYPNKSFFVASAFFFLNNFYCYTKSLSHMSPRFMRNHGLLYP